jgi:hypothetical protein
MRAIHAPNPLAWWIAARIRHESELACDDAVLDRGVDAEAYAGELLAIARQSRGRKLAPAMLGMARKTGLTSRIRALTDQRRVRDVVTRRAILVASIVAAGIGVPLVACKVVAQQIHPSLPQPVAGIGFVPSDLPVWKGTGTVRVVDSAGRPVANADIGVGFLSQFMFGIGNGDKVLKTDSNGVCRFTDHDLDPKFARGKPIMAVAHAAGLGVASGSVNSHEPVVLPASASVRLSSSTSPAKAYRGWRFPLLLS